VAPAKPIREPEQRKVNRSIPAIQTGDIAALECEE